MNPAHAKLIREQAQREMARTIARSFLSMPWWKRLKLALFPRWV